MKTIAIIFTVFITIQSIGASAGAPSLEHLLAITKRHQRSITIGSNSKPGTSGYDDTATLCIETPISSLDGLQKLPGAEYLTEIIVNPDIPKTKKRPLLHVSNTALKNISPFLKTLRIFQPVTFEGWTLATLRSLTYLDLQYASLEKIPDLYVLINLERLSLAHNKITIVKEGDLQLPSLRAVDLGFNGLKIDESKFVSKTLNALFLDHNHLPVLVAGLFATPLLRQLDVSHVGLREVKEGALEKLELEKLYMNGNELALSNPKIALKMWGFSEGTVCLDDQKVTTKEIDKAYLKERSWAKKNRSS